MEDFNEWEFQDLSNAACPNCGDNVPDISNGNDPAAWWSSENIPDCDLKHKCSGCGQVFRISVNWSPLFTVIPIEHDEEYEDDYSGLDEA